MNDDIDMKGKFLAAYASSNIIIHRLYCPNALINTNKSLWLAAMGMLDTLIISGVEAEIWDSYEG